MLALAGCGGSTPAQQLDDELKTVEQAGAVADLAGYCLDPDRFDGPAAADKLIELARADPDENRAALADAASAVDDCDPDLAAKLDRAREELP
jgi:hypothetical protein